MRSVQTPAAPICFTLSFTTCCAAPSNVITACTELGPEHPACKDLLRFREQFNNRLHRTCSPPWEQFNDRLHRTLPPPLLSGHVALLGAVQRPPAPHLPPPSCQDLSRFWEQFDDRLLRIRVVPALLSEMRGRGGGSQGDAAFVGAALPVTLSMMRRLGPAEFESRFLPLLAPLLDSAQVRTDDLLDFAIGRPSLVCATTWSIFAAEAIPMLSRPPLETATLPRERGGSPTAAGF
eukprot:352205-Chlamydomonas_euryale.AAC.14